MGTGGVDREDGSTGLPRMICHVVFTEGRHVDVRVVLVFVSVGGASSSEDDDDE